MDIILMIKIIFIVLNFGGHKWFSQTEYNYYSLTIEDKNQNVEIILKFKFLENQLIMIL